MRNASPDNVVGLIAKPPEEYNPEPRYVSKYREKVIEASKRGKSAHKTFGVPSVVFDTQGQRLKKSSVPPLKRPEVHHRHYQRPDYQRKLPEWKPIKASELAKRSAARKVDFAKLNVEEMTRLRPRKPRMYCVDDRHGHVYPLMLSGMYPYYRNKKSYGQVPGKVLTSNKRQVKPKVKGSPQKVSRVDDTKLKRSKKPEASPRRGIPQRKKEEKKKQTEVKKMIEKPKKSPKRGPEIKAHKKPEAKDNKVEKAKAKHTVKEKRLKPIAKTEIEKEDDKSEGRDTECEGSASDRSSISQKDSNGEKSESSDETSKSLEEVSTEDSSSQVGSLKSVETKQVSTARTVYVECQPPCSRYVTEDERAELLYGMKKKWDEMMKQFQCLPFMTDTPPKMKKKSRMEKDLLQLEKDIETIERHPYIYVYSDPED